MTANKICPITGKAMKPVFAETVLGKYNATYYYCDESGILQTENDNWLNEAYEEAIANTDTGLLSRNIYAQKRLEPILQTLFGGQGSFLDVGGGYGILTRLLRDIGFDCYSTDKYCENLFSKEFEPFDGFRATALLAFEVLEHIDAPKRFISDVFSKYRCNTLIFSTLVYGDTIPSKDWWYYSFETGQHITFYQSRTLELLATGVGCHYFMIQPDLHIITDQLISRSRRVVLSNKHLFKLMSIYTRRRRKWLSKTFDDYVSIKSSVLGQQRDPTNLSDGVPATATLGPTSGDQIRVTMSDR